MEVLILLQRVYILDIYNEAKTQVGLGETGTAPPKVVFFLYMNDFEATRRFLEALKTAGDS